MSFNKTIAPKKLSKKLSVSFCESFISFLSLFSISSVIKRLQLTYIYPKPSFAYITNINKKQNVEIKITRR